MPKSILEGERVILTIEQLKLRIAERFPDSGLSKVAETLHRISLETGEVLSWIERPNRPLRWAVAITIALLSVVIVVGTVQVALDASELGPAELVGLAEAATNELLLIGAAIVFLISLETRAKRRRITEALNRLRSVAHVIDAHQLTKDPWTAKGLPATAHSPKRTLEPAMLARYLDYCSELLSLSSKLGFLYVQSFPDAQAAESAADLEQLTTGLSRKIWQKLMILHAETPPAPK